MVVHLQPPIIGDQLCTSYTLLSGWDFHHFQLSHLKICKSTCEGQSSVEERTMIQAIIDSLEKCWSKQCDKDVFLAGVILNPLYRIQPFACAQKFTNAGVISLFVKLWGWFYPHTPHEIFWNEVLEYLEGCGDHGEDFVNWVDFVQSSTEKEVCSHCYSNFKLIVVADACY